ncbi:MAG: ABC transporter substrate-binding protein [Cyanobacteria bacterium J06614_10]
MTQSPSPKLRRRHALQLFAGASGAFLLHACQPKAEESPSAAGTSSSGGEAGGGSMALSMGSAPWVGQVPLYIAQQQGFFEEEGLDFDLSLFGASGDYISAFMGGNVDSVAPVSAEAVLMRSQGKDFKIVLIQDNSVGGDGILARNSIESIEDFRGQKVAVDTTGVSYFFLLQVLKEAGLTKDDITVINADAPSAAAAFESGNVDIAVSYAPYLQQTDRSIDDGRIIYDSSKMPTAIIDLYLFDTAFIEENPAAVQAFVNAIFKGTQFMDDNPDEMLEIGANELEVTPEELASDLQGVKIPSVEDNLKMLAQPDSDIYIAQPLQELADFLLAEGLIESDPGDLSALLEPRFVQAYQEAQA